MYGYAPGILEHVAENHRRVTSRTTRFRCTTAPRDSSRRPDGAGASTALRSRAAAAYRRTQPDAGGDRLIDERVERRGAQRLEHRIPFDPVGSYVSGLKGVVGFVGHHFVKSAYWVASSRSASSSALVTRTPIIHELCGSLLTASGCCTNPEFHFSHLTAHRTVQLGHGLHGLDRPEDLTSLQCAADSGKLQVDDIAELLLRVVGDADPRVASGGAHPFVILRVFKSGGYMSSPGSWGQSRFSIDFSKYSANSKGRIRKSDDP